MHDTTSVDDGVTSLCALVENAMEEAISRGFITKSEFPYWLSVSLMCDAAQKSTFYGPLESSILIFFTINFPFIVS
jgi:hypothetical protein